MGLGQGSTSVTFHPCSSFISPTAPTLVWAQLGTLQGLLHILFSLLLALKG